MKREILKDSETDAVPIVEHLFTGGEILPAQLSRSPDRSAEKELAAAVLMDALIEVRDFNRHPLHKRKVGKDLEWIFSDDPEWPFSFVRLCEVFDLEPACVREIVLRWLIGPKVNWQHQVGRCRPAA